MAEMGFSEFYTIKTTGCIKDIAWQAAELFPNMGIYGLLALIIESVVSLSSQGRC